MKFVFPVALVACAGLGACSPPPVQDPESLASPSHDLAREASIAIDADIYMGHVETLSSDEFGGRAPASPGEEKTVAYLSEQFQAAGLKPGNGDSFFQDVPLVTITAAPAPLTVSRDGQTTQVMTFGPDVVMGTSRVAEKVSIENSELVYVGYGIVAPEYDWNDYADVDVRGKTVVVLVNDPGFATQNADLFNGNAMTYYGRWTYKFEEAARQGAAAALIVHEALPASYPWGVVEAGWSGPQHTLVSPDGNASSAAIEGWISMQQAEALFASAGLDYAAQRDAASQRGFSAQRLGLSASATLTNTIEYSDSKNVIALLPGATRPDEYIIFMAHWDHLGTNPELEGDQIYNGAVDNATGTAALLVLAEAFAQAETPPGRSLVFIAVTAEESGLLGSAYYGENPVYPLAQTVAGINMDALNVYGRTRDVAVVGYGSSELEKYLAAQAASQQRNIVPEPSPEKGSFYRSDHFNLAKKGVPVLYAKSGGDYRDGGVTKGESIAKHHTANIYHQPADEINESWDVGGVLDDLALFYGIVEVLAAEERFPEWYPGTEFRAIREASLSEAR